MRCLAVLAVVWATVPAFGQMNANKESKTIPVTNILSRQRAHHFGDFHFVEERVSDSIKDDQSGGHRYLNETVFRGPEGSIETHCWWSINSNNLVESVSCVFDGPGGTEPIVFLMSVHEGVGSGIILADRVLFVEVARHASGEQEIRFRNRDQQAVAKFPGTSLFNVLNYDLLIHEEQTFRATLAMFLTSFSVHQMRDHWNEELQSSGLVRPRNGPTHSLPITSCPNSTPGSIEGHTEQLKELQATEWQALLEAHDRKLCIDRAGKVLIERQPDSYWNVNRLSRGFGVTIADTSLSAQDAKSGSLALFALGHSLSLGLSRGPLLYLLDVNFTTSALTPGRLVRAIVLKGEFRYSFFRLKYLESVAGLSLQFGTRYGLQLGLAAGPLLGLQMPIDTSSISPQSRLVLFVDAIPRVGFWSRSLIEGEFIPGRTEFGVQVITGIRLEI